MGRIDLAPIGDGVLMVGLVACFSGRIATGKTSVTQMLAEALGWRRTSFSDYLRALLAEQGNSDPTREALQDLGQALVTSDPDKFCRDVLTHGGFVPGGSFLLDGIRHVDIQERVVRLVAPSHCCLIHLAASDEVVAQRFLERGASEEELRRAESHVVERDLAAALPQVADAVVDASQPIAAVLEQCLNVIRTR